MIEYAKIIDQPYSGEFQEKIYDNESPWNSQGWTWVKFVNDGYTEWCGNFRGFSKQVAISKIYDRVLILTSDYLFQINRLTGDLIELEDLPQYHSITVTPKGEFLIADRYDIRKIKYNLKEKEIIDSPIKMDNIEFDKWDGVKFNFTCYELYDWGKHFKMQYDSTLDKIVIKNAF